ncbi:MAG: hypothetical protein OEU92_00495 [Alphaproteobacteria bacterium]|nr:hypothetical protein [Alphaproteobacteria bacterium]
MSGTALRYWIIMPLGAWLVLGTLFTFHTMRSQRAVIESELQQQAADLHRLVSQRADQHDAHLTSLSALALADGQRPDHA